LENKIINYFNKIVPLSEEEVKAIAATMHIKPYKKGTVLLKKGKFPPKRTLFWQAVCGSITLLVGKKKRAIFYRRAMGDCPAKFWPTDARQPLP
jgi:CRP-like cAMP-binding protein